MSTFSLTLSQMAVFFAFMAVGFLFRKARITPDDTGAVLSKLELYVFLPALCFNTFSSNLRVETLREELPILLWSCGILLATFLLSLVLSAVFTKSPTTRAVYIYALTIPNIGYIGYPLVRAVFGEAVLLDFMIYAIPYNLFIYTVGTYILNPKHEFSWRTLLNPSLIAIAAGAVVGLCGWKAPGVVSDILDAASGCMGPMAMLLTGYVLARNPIIQMLRSWRMFVANLIRLVLLPAAFGALLYLVGADRYITLLTCCVLALPMGLNNVVFPEAFGGDSHTGAQSCFLSNVMALATVPVAYGLIARFFG